MGLFGKKKKIERIFDKDGFDQDRWDRQGYDRQGYNVAGNDRNGNNKPDNYVEKIIAKSITLRITEQFPPIDKRYFDDQLKYKIIEKEQNEVNIPYFDSTIHFEIIEKNPKDKQVMINSSTRISYDFREEEFDEINKLKNELKKIQIKGDELMEKENYELALSNYDNVLSKFPSNEHSLSNKGFCLFKLGKIQQALDCYTKILSNNPNHQLAIENKIKLLETFGDQYREELSKLYKKLRVTNSVIGTWQEIHDRESSKTGSEND